MKKGFTLIELLVVVLIIGILSAIALPQYKKAVIKARTAEAITILSSAQRAVDLYILENGYPADQSGTPVIFTGEQDSHTLSLDLSNLATSSDDPTRYLSKHFRYEGFCNYSLCSFEALYCPKEKAIDDCYVGADMFTLTTRRSKANGQQNRYVTVYGVDAQGFRQMLESMWHN